MEFRLLGPLEVVDDDGRKVPLERPRLRALLAFLLLHANREVSSGRLLVELWGEEAPPSATASLQNYVSRLRRSLGPDVLLSRPRGYLLRVDPERFDLARFDRLVEEARAASPQGRAELLRAALSLWRGPPLEDLLLEDFAQVEIEQLAERRADALEECIAAELELGGGPELVDELEALVEAKPLRERARAQLMLALYRAGRQADALDVYREARRALGEELGLEPGEELRALQRRILEQDPSLRAKRGGPSVEESRRTVTVLFCDVVGSTRLAAGLDPEAYRRVMSAYLEAARGAIEPHGGVVEKFIGDAVLALFGVPELHEDDALRAVRAAVDVRAAVEDLDELTTKDWGVRLAVRIAVNTGEVIVAGSGAEPAVSGVAVNAGAHLQQRAGAGEILLGEETWRATRDAIRAEALELDEGGRAWRLAEVVAGAPPVARRLDAPLVGRKKELRRLRQAFQRVRKEGACSVVTVVGEAGIGKTRLARELLASLGDQAPVLVGRCVAYGAGATYLPIAEIVRQAAPEASAAGVAALLAGVADAELVASQVAGLAGLADGPAAPGEPFWAIRRLLETIARDRGLVVALEDVHWAEPTLLDLVQYLGEWADAPLLLLCLARPELLETRPGWGGPTSTGTLLELEPLPADDVGCLVEELSGEPLSADVRARIVDHAGGNPLFAEQLVALAAEAPDLLAERVPSSVEALIASRLGHLEADELTALRRAAVIGRRFSRAELRDLGPVDGAALAGLVRRGLVEPIEDGFSIHHVLVRDVAYAGIPKAERAELHESVADGLARRDAADELVGYHLEQAFRHRVELARVDDRGRRLAAAAGERLGRAGVRAGKRADVPASTNLLARAADLLPEADRDRRELLCELGVMLRMTGDHERAGRVLADAMTVSATAGDRRVELRARLELANIRWFRDPHTSARDLLAAAVDAIPTFESLGDERALGRAWLAVGLVRGGVDCRNAEWQEAAERAAGHYRRAGWSPATCLGGLAAALYYGPSPVREALEHCARLLAEQGDDRMSEANVLVWMGGLEAMLGRFEEARRRVADARAMYEEFGQTIAAEDTCGLVEGATEMLAGRHDRAEQALRRACETCIRLDESALLATRAAELAAAIHAQGRFEEAARWAQLAQERAGGEDVHAQVLWRSVQAKLRAQQGESAEAERLGREALALVESTDSLNNRAQVLLDLAEVVRLAGVADEAAELNRQALSLYEQKGNLVAAERVRALLYEPSRA